MSPTDLDTRLLTLARTRGHTPARERAIATVSTLVGALIISRAVDDPELADEVLVGAREVLLGAAG